MHDFRVLLLGVDEAIIERLRERVSGDFLLVVAARLQALPGLLAGGNVLAEAIVSSDSPEKEKLLVVLSVERIASRLVTSAGEQTGTMAVVPGRELLNSVRNGTSR